MQQQGAEARWKKGRLRGGARREGGDGGGRRHGLLTTCSDDTLFPAS